jgi:hypothetical protein
VTKADGLVRSDNLAKLSADGIAAAVADGVGTVIDLRFPEEIAKAPNPFQTEARGVTYLHRPLMTTDYTEALNWVREAVTTREAYRATLEGFGGHIAAIVHDIAEADVVQDRLALLGRQRPHRIGRSVGAARRRC